jgi:hypothetical protein
MPLNESIIEDAALECSGEMRYGVGHGSKQARTLATLRDTLLPKQLNGKLSATSSEGKNIRQALIFKALTTEIRWWSRGESNP